MDYIKVYDLDMETDKYIDLFDNNVVNKHEQNWRRCEIYTKLDSQKEVFEEFKSLIRSTLYRYRTEIQNPNLHFLQFLEAPNIIKYTVDDPKGSNYFHPHSDNWNMQTASRQLSIIIYLNDVEEGGATKFTELDIKVTPKKGRILIFPSFYTYIHTGEAPVSNSKYIIVSWIHFGGNGHAFRVHKL